MTNDRSAPIVVGKTPNAGSTPVGGAPPVPGAPRPPGGLAPPAPGNRVRSNSDQGSRDASSMEAVPQLGGLFAGGMPKLKSRGGVNTGASRDSSYTSDPESSVASAPRPPTTSAPRPPISAAPRLAPFNQRPLANVPSLNNLKRTNLSGDQRPVSSVSFRGPPPPIGKKPPPPPGSRKHSSPLPPSSSAPPPPSAPPAPPAAPRHPPPSPASNGISQSLAMQAVKRAATEAAAPRVSPPLPPAFSAPPPLPAAPLPPPFHAPTPPASAPPSQTPAAPPSRLSSVRSMLDPSSYTLSSHSNGNGQQNKARTTRRSVSSSKAGIIPIEDPRFKFQSEDVFPTPRHFHGGARRYRAGRGSSVPLDLSAFQ